MLPALGLGRKAVALGLETLDVALIHVQAVLALASPGHSPRTRRSMIERSKRFFAEAIVPIEKTHRGALRTNARVNQLTRALRRRMAESSVSTQHLKRDIAKRQRAETALTSSREHRARLLQRSARLQNRLRDRTREMLSAQEDERQRASRQLRDEVAQALLAIHVRLLALKKAVKRNTKNLGTEFAETQQLVKQSVQTMHRLARGSNGDNQA